MDRARFAQLLNESYAQQGMPVFTEEEIERVWLAYLEEEARARTHVES
jgi:hypothetical protein